MGVPRTSGSGEDGTVDAIAGAPPRLGGCSACEQGQAGCNHCGWKAIEVFAYYGVVPSARSMGAGSREGSCRAVAGDDQEVASMENNGCNGWSQALLLGTSAYRRPAEWTTMANKPGSKALRGEGGSDAGRRQSRMSWFIELLESRNAWLRAGQENGCRLLVWEGRWSASYG